MTNKAELVQPALFPILKVLHYQADKSILQTAILTMSMRVVQSGCWLTSDFCGHLHLCFQAWRSDESQLAAHPRL